MEGVLVLFVVDVDGSGRFVFFEEFVGEVEVGFGGYEVEDCLERSQVVEGVGEKGGGDVFGCCYLDFC